MKCSGSVQFSLGLSQDIWYQLDNKLILVYEDQMSTVLSSDQVRVLLLSQG